MNRTTFIITILVSIAIILLSTNDANAGCRVSCCGKSPGCRMNYGLSTYTSSVCLVGNPVDNPGCYSWEVSTECSKLNKAYCKEGGCQDTSYDPSDHNCIVYQACGDGIFTCWPKEMKGKWSVNTKECVQCSGNIKTWKYADASGIYANCDGNPTLDIADRCEFACGADSKCDEADNAAKVAVPGGTCNFCVFAAGPGGPGPAPGPRFCKGPIVPCGGEGNPCQFCDIFVLIDNVIKFILTCLTPILAGLMLTLGGFYFLMAGPSPEKVRDAKAIITAAVIGLVIIFVAWIFLNTFLSYIGLASWTGTWWQIQCQ